LDEKGNKRKRDIEEGVVGIHALLVLCQSPSLVEDSPTSSSRSYVALRSSSAADR